MVMHSFNPSAWEAEESGYLCVLDQPNLHKSFLTVRPPQGPYLKQRRKKKPNKPKQKNHDNDNTEVQKNKTTVKMF